MGDTLGQENGNSHLHVHERPFISIYQKEVDNSVGRSENKASSKEFQENLKGQDRHEFEQVAFQWLSQSLAKSSYLAESEVAVVGDPDSTPWPTSSSNRALIGIEDLVDEGLYRDTFIEMCHNNLTEKQTLTVGDSITTTDIFDFLTGLCRDDPNCDGFYYPDGIPLNYDGLNVEIQLEWLWTICPPSWRSSASCLENLQEEQGIDDYGLLIRNESERWIVFDQTLDFCRRIWPHRQHTDGKPYKRNYLSHFQ